MRPTSNGVGPALYRAWAYPHSPERGCRWNRAPGRRPHFRALEPHGTPYGRTVLHGGVGSYVNYGRAVHGVRREDRASSHPGGEADDRGGSLAPARERQCLGANRPPGRGPQDDGGVECRTSLTPTRRSLMLVEIPDELLT